MSRSRAIIRGHVQGVFFRDSVRRRAHDLDVAGWVRNRADGSVEAVFEGSPESIRKLIDYCRSGPPGAHVEAVDVTQETPQGEQGFEVR